MHIESSDTQHKNDIVVCETEYQLFSHVSEVIWKVLVSFCSGLTFAAFVSLLLRIPLSRIHFLIALLFCIIFVALNHLNTPKKTFIIGCLVCIGVIFLVIKISEPLLDFSYDGRCYHYLAIHSIRAGWNPIFDPFPNNWAVYQTACATYSMLYPKSYWYAGAIIENSFGNFEAAKSINLLWGVSVFFLSFSKLGYFRLQPVYKVLISAAITLNPVAISQWFTNYVDGQLYYCQVIVIILLISQLINKNTSEFTYMGFVIIYLINLKFTGLLYTVIYLGAAFLFVLLVSKELKKSVPLVVTSVVSILIAFFLVGYNPYLTNYFKYKDPLYPWGFTAQDSQTNIDGVMEKNRPVDFNQLDRFGRLFRSLFSVSSNEVSSSVLKIPFSIKLKEIIEFQSPDVRVGGFGPLFSGAFVVSGLLLVVILIFLRDRRIISLMVVLILFLSIFASEEGWWARYAPQTWLIPVFISIIILEKSEKFVFQRLGIALILILLVNSYLISAINLSSNISASEYIKSEISRVSSMNRRIFVRYNNMLSFDQTLNRYQVKHSVIEDGASFPCPANYIDGLEYSLAKCKGEIP